MTSFLVLFILLLYALIMYWISRRTRKQNQSFQDTIAAPRRATLLLLVGSAVGGQIGSGFVMGGGAYGAQYGLSGAWYGIGCGLSYFVTVLLAKFIHERHLVSLADYFSQRYHGTTIRLIYSTTGILSCIAMISGQLLASRAIFVTLGFPPQFGVIFTATVAFVYANASGLWGTMAISSLQSAILFLGMIAALWRLCSCVGLEPLLQSLPDSAFEIIPSDKEFLFSMAGPIILASAVNQISFQCITSAKSVRTAQSGYLLAGLFLIPCAFIAPILGMFGRSLFPGAASEQVFSTLLLSRLPIVIAATIFAAVICSVVISCTSAYIVVGTNAVYDIYQGILNPKAEQDVCKKLMFWVDSAVCVLSIFFALKLNDIIQVLSVGYSLIAAGCLVPFLGGVFWNRGNTPGALASAAAGMGACLLDALGIIYLPYASCSCILISLAAYVAVSLCSARRSPISP